MSNSTKRIESQFLADDAARQGSLNVARRCAELTDPSVMPPQGQSLDSLEPEQFQSLGARGMANMEGRMLLALYPPGQLWVQLGLAPKIDLDPGVPSKTKQMIRDGLSMRELALVALLESSGLRSDDGGSNVRQQAFRSQKRTAITQILITGETLEHLTDDFRLKVFARDQYVTRRTSSGDVLYHIVRESIDPLTLSEDQLAKAKLSKVELQKKKSFERFVDIFTFIEWQPLTRKWTLCQELAGHEVNELDEDVPSYFCTPFSLSPKANYGRGFVEKNRGDLHTYNELRERILDFSVLASKLLYIKDPSSRLTAADLAKPTGSAIVDQVVNGMATKIAMLQSNKLSDFKIVETVTESVRKELAKSMLIESEVTPQGERVTATQVNRVVQELQGALGGPYAAIAESQQIPLARRGLWQAEQQGILPKLNAKVYQMRATTGIGALGRAAKAQDVTAFVQTIAQMGPEALARINIDILIRTIARYQGINEPGLIKSEDDIRKEMQAAMQQQAAAKAIDVGGNAIEQNLADQSKKSLQLAG